MDTLVNQTTPSQLAEGAVGQIKLSRSGALVDMPFINQCIAEGRGFQVSNAAKQTALAMGGLSYSDTVPALNIDVPTGYTLIPLKILLNQGGTVAGGVISAIITYDNIIRYGSSGTGITPGGLRSDLPAASSVSVYGTTPTIAAKSKDWTIWSGILKHDVGTSPNDVPNKVDLDFFKDFLPILVGPASLQLYTFAATTQPSWFFRIAWVEIPSINLK